GDVRFMSSLYRPGPSPVHQQGTLSEDVGEGHPAAPATQLESPAARLTTACARLYDSISIACGGAIDVGYIAEINSGPPSGLPETPAGRTSLQHVGRRG